ncbi:hypothetical protein, partial [Cohaesibacter sp. CAU 1516]|uniref:hypothetical protein n=1 Tax=Cohaesibacter sp. CAU 1516 TaxID=2576038 RepID=UPI001AED3F94
AFSKSYATNKDQSLRPQTLNFGANRPAASSAAAVDEPGYRPTPNQSQTLKYIFMTTIQDKSETPSETAEICQLQYAQLFKNMLPACMVRQSRGA